MTLDNQYPPSSNVPYNNHPSQQQQQWPNIPLSQHPSHSSSVPEPSNINTAAVGGSRRDHDFVPSSLSSIPAGGDINGTISNSHQQPGDTITPEQQPPLDPNKEYHAEWGVMRDQEFHQLALKHQRDLENHHLSGSPISDFYFWQANLGGYCMADMHQSKLYEIPPKI